MVRRGPGLLVLIVDAASSEAAPVVRADWARAIAAGSGHDRRHPKPTYVVIDLDANPAVALRVRWTLRLFDADEGLPHAAGYVVRRRDGRLLPVSALGRAVGWALTETRAAELRQALVASARRGWRARPPLAGSWASAVATVKAAFDSVGPVFTAAPGPLRPVAVALLLAAARRGDEAAAGLARQTLDSMARGGVRDQLDGGFFQGARDPGWRLPDWVRTATLNAALLGVYAVAAAQFSERSFADVARGIAGYLRGTLRDPGTGAFFTRQAADETYYTWTSSEVTAALPARLVQAACMHFNVQPAARVVGDPRKNVLYVAADAAAIAGFVDQPAAAVAEQVDEARAVLRAARTRRAAPRLGRADFVDVNAQVCSALLAGARALDEPALATEALQTLAWLEAACFAGDTPTVPHRVDPYLGDYAALGQALLDAHECTREPRYLARAEAVATKLAAQFRDRQSGALLDTPRESLVSRAFWPEQPLEDRGGPSPAATAIRLLLDLGRRTRRARYHRAAADALRSGASAAADDPLAAAGYYLALGEWLPKGKAI